MSPIRTASGASLRTPKNYNSANRSYNYNNNYGYRNHGYNNRGYYNQRGYYNRWNRGRGNWRGQYNYRNQWNDRRRYNSRSDRSRSKSRSRSYDSRDSRSRSSSYDRSRSRSRSRDNKRRRTRSQSDRKSRSRSPRPKSIDRSKSEKKSPAKQEETKPTAITVPSTTELVTEPEIPDEDNDDKEEQSGQEKHFAETSAFTRSRWETPDGSPGKKESANVDLNQDEIFDRWDDDKLREYLLKSKGQKVRKESKKSTDSVEQEKVSSKKKKKRAKRESTSREARRSSSHDVSSDSSFSPIHKAPDKKEASDGQEKYLPPEYDDEDNQSVEMQENSPPHLNEPDSPQEGKKDEKNEAVRYPFAHIKSPVPPPTQPPPPKQPTPVLPPTPTLPSLGEMQVLGPDGRPMKLVPVSILGPDGNMIQVMQLQPIAVPQPIPELPKPVEPPKPPPQQKASLPTTYPTPHQYQRAVEGQRSSRTDREQNTDMKSSPAPPIKMENSFPFSTNDHTENLRKMEMSQKMTRKLEVTKTRFKPKPAGSWATEMCKKEPQVPPMAEIPKKDPPPEKVATEQKGLSIPSLVDASGKAKSMGSEIFTEQKIQTITTTQSVRKVLQPRRSDQIWDIDNEETKTGGIQEKSDPVGQEPVKVKSDKKEQTMVTEKIASQHKIERDSVSKSMSKEPDSSENEGSVQLKRNKNASSDESGDEVVKRKKDKKKKKKNKKKQKEDEGGTKKKKKKQKEKSMETSVVLSLEHETIKSKKDLKAFDEMNKKAKVDNLVRTVDENLPLSHVRSMVPRKDDAGAKPIFQHLASDDLASSSSYEDRFVSLFGSGSAEPAPKSEERIDLTKKSVRKLKVNIEGTRAVSHMTEITISDRIRHFKDGTDVVTTDQSSQKVSLNISGISGKTKSSLSRSRSRSVSSSASSEPPKKVKKKRKKSRRSSSSSRSRSRSLPAAYGGDDEKTPGKRRRDDSEGDSRRRSRDRYSRSPSTSGDERDRGRRQMYYNRNNQGYYYNNRGRGYYQNRNRGWQNYNYNNRGGYRGRWNNWNQGWNRNQNWRNQRYRDRYSRERSRSRSRSDRSTSSPDNRRSRSPARDKSPTERRRSENLTKNTEQNQKTADGDTKGTDAVAPSGYNISEDEKPPGVD